MYLILNLLQDAVYIVDQTQRYASGDLVYSWTLESLSFLSIPLAKVLFHSVTADVSED